MSLIPLKASVGGEPPWRPSVAAIIGSLWSGTTQPSEVICTLRADVSRPIVNTWLECLPSDTKAVAEPSSLLVEGGTA